MPCKKYIPKKSGEAVTESAVSDSASVETPESAVSDSMSEETPESAIPVSNAEIEPISQKPKVGSKEIKDTIAGLKKTAVQNKPTKDKKDEPGPNASFEDKLNFFKEKEQRGGAITDDYIKSPRQPIKEVGSRREVFNGTAKRTSGNLEQKDLILNKYHRIVSKKKYYTAKRENRLEKHGYFAKKGIFGVVKKSKNAMKTIYTKSSKPKKKNKSLKQKK